MGYTQIGIYKITSPSGRIYIGQSIDLKRRFTEYRNYGCHSQIKLNYSFKKYGIDSHTFEVVEYCSESQLNERERYWQDEYEVLTKGLNCRLTTTKSKSGQLSSETKKKISDSLKGVPKRDGFGENLSKKKMGHEVTLEARIKISKTLSGRTLNDNDRYNKSVSKYYYWLGHCAIRFQKEFQNYIK